MKLYNEEQILNANFRKLVIDEIEGNENKERKMEALKRYEIFKDKTKKYILDALSSESQDKKVVNEILNRAANISFCRKIIDKKAMVYKEGVSRVVDNIEDQEKIDEIIDYLNFNTAMKKTNKYAELFKNAVVEVMPYLDPKEEKWTYTLRVLPPYLYDVIEDEINPEIARVYIKSYFNNSFGTTNKYVDENRAGFREGLNRQILKDGDGKDQIIADTPSDFGSNKKEYVWWSNKYHFTTNCRGEILSGKQEEDLSNPIGELPFYNFSQNQDGQFWAEGGNDIIDGTITLNILLTDMYYIAKYQGMGIGYLFGKGVPKNLKVGASSFISIDVEEGDAMPNIGFASSNPPINAHLDMIRETAAYILKTNSLEVETASGDMNANGAASGVHEMIRKSEYIDDLINQREIYRDGEPHLFKLISKWHNLYFEQNALIDRLQKLGKLDNDIYVAVKFTDIQPFMTETEKLNIIEKRKSLGLDSDLDAMLRDNPDLTQEEALEKVSKIKEDKKAKFPFAFNNQVDKKDNEVDNKDGEDKE